MRDQRDRVDAIWQRADIGPPGAFRELVRLPGVEEIADDQRDGAGRQHPPIEQFRRKAEHEPAEIVDEQELDEIIERQAEEAVEITADEGTHIIFRCAATRVCEGSAATISAQS